MMCVNRPDGTNPHLKNCKAYMLCSNGIAYPVHCPKGLVFSGKQHGCDFDIDGKCLDEKGKETVTEHNV